MLYPDCKQGLKKLGTTLEMLQWKAANGVSDQGFEELLGLVKKMLPEGNKLPPTTYEAKKGEIVTNMAPFMPFSSDFGDRMTTQHLD